MRAKSRHHPPIRKRSDHKGKTYYLVDLGRINGIRRRRSFTTKGEAEVCAQQHVTQKRNEGIAAFSLSTSVRVDAGKAYHKLAPHGVSLDTAADYYLEHVIAFKEAPTVAQVVDRMVKDAGTLGRRPRTVKDLENRLERFSKAFGTRQLSGLAFREVSEWVSGLGLSPRSRINYATKLSQLFNYAVKNGWTDTNLAARIARPEAEDKEPGILTVKQAEQLLSKADQFGLLPYISIGLFAGLRTAELARLDWSAVKFSERAIIVGAEVAKKRSRRVVEISDSLAAWLAPYVRKSGPIIGKDRTLYDHLERLQKAAEIQKWPHNALRHSFGSYHLAAFGNPIQTATQMGHASAEIVHNHYKALVLKSEAEKFWKLRPAKAQNIIPMQQTA